MFEKVLDSISLIRETDAEVADAMSLELARQKRNIELIASENIVSPAVLAAMGSVLTNKYAEGYPAKRYYGGCECVDIVENIAGAGGAVAESSAVLIGNTVVGSLNHKT